MKLYVITVRISGAVRRWLSRESKAAGVGRSEVVRRLMESRMGFDALRERP